MHPVNTSTNPVHPSSASSRTRSSLPATRVSTDSISSQPLTQSRYFSRTTVPTDLIQTATPEGFDTQQLFESKSEREVKFKAAPCVEAAFRKTSVPIIENVPPRLDMFTSPKSFPTIVTDISLGLSKIKRRNPRCESCMKIGKELKEYRKECFRLCEVLKLEIRSKLVSREIEDEIRLKIECANLEKDKKRLNEMVNAARKEIVRLEIRLEEETKSNQRINKENREKFLTENETIRKELDTALKEISQLRTSHEDISAKNEKCSEAIKELKKENQQLREMQAKLDAEKQSLIQIVEEKDEKIRLFEEKAIDLAQKLAQEQQRSLSILEEKQSILAKFSEDLAERESQIVTLQAEKLTSDAEMSTLRQSFDSKSKECSSLLSDLTAERTRSTHEKQLLSEQTSRCSILLESLNTKTVALSRSLASVFKSINEQLGEKNMTDADLINVIDEDNSGYVGSDEFLLRIERIGVTVSNIAAKPMIVLLESEQTGLIDLKIFGKELTKHQ